MCGGKKTYSRNEAERMKKAVGRGRDKDVRFYRCDKCYGFHLTKKHSEYGKY